MATGSTYDKRSLLLGAEAEAESALLKLYAQKSLYLWQTWHSENLERRKRIQTIVERGVASEKGFLREVLGATFAMAEQQAGPVALIVDLDDTVLRNTYNSDGAISDTIVRPAFGIAIRGLTKSLGDRLELGVLTARGQSYLDDKDGLAVDLAGVANKINPNLVASSRDDETVEAINSRRFRIESSLESVGEFMDEQFMPQIAAAAYSGSHQYSKPFVLNQFLDQNLETAFVVVDDHEWVQHINPLHPRVRGVHMDAHARFMFYG